MQFCLQYCCLLRCDVMYLNMVDTYQSFGVQGTYRQDTLSKEAVDAIRS
jgi:hypothetical protein